MDILESRRPSSVWGKEARRSWVEPAFEHVLADIGIPAGQDLPRTHRSGVFPTNRLRFDPMPILSLRAAVPW